MAFQRIGTLSPYGAPVKRSQIITNSITTTEMDSVKLASGFIALGTAGALVFGHVMAIGTKFGVGLSTTGVAGAEMGSFVGTFATASDNQTVAMVKAECDISKETLYSASFETAIGTTTGSNLAGYFCDLDSEFDLDESDTTTTTMQYALHGVDPSNSAKAIVNIYESQVYGS
jgi:hypothetical protein